MQSTTHSWDFYRDNGTISDNEMLLSMMRQTVNTANALKAINERYYAITIDSLVREYVGLRNLAMGRGLKEYPELF